MQARRGLRIGAVLGSVLIAAISALARSPDITAFSGNGLLTWTNIAGKWHLGDDGPAALPTRRGFEHQYGFMGDGINSFTHIGGGKRDAMSTDWFRDDHPCADTGYAGHLLQRQRWHELGASSLSHAATGTSSPILTPAELRCQGLVDPQGIDAVHPTLRWMSTSADPVVRGQTQTAYQILVADAAAALAANTGNLWDSGKVAGDRSTQIVYAGKPLSSHQACYWKVRGWNGDGVESPWSAPALWTMGFVAPDAWQPNWVGGESRTPLLRKEFTLSKPVKCAWIYASALGIYELRLNGGKVGTDLFAPGWTDYRMRVQYQRYDVTALVQQGANALGAALAPGWFAGRIGWFNINKYGKTIALAAQLQVVFTDGSTQTIATDATWKTANGPLTDSDIQGGDQYDARLEKPGWDKPGYNAAGWQGVTVQKNERRLVAQMDQSAGVIGEITPVGMKQQAAGHYIYDLGQNITGVVRIKVQGSKGTTITLRHAEHLNADGTLDFTNLKEAKATDTYILSGNASRPSSRSSPSMDSVGAPSRA